jgi:hypothetical protein
MDSAMVSEERKFQALLRSDFRAFVHKAFTTLCPGQEYVSTWHVEAIARQLERVRRGEIRRLIINMPPRSLKSIMASVAFPAFVLGHDPSRRIICVSYSGDLSRKHSNDFRAVLEAPWYRRMFPNARGAFSKEPVKADGSREPGGGPVQRRARVDEKRALGLPSNRAAMR